MQFTAAAIRATEKGFVFKEIKFNIKTYVCNEF